MPIDLRMSTTYREVCDLPTPVRTAQIAMTGLVDLTIVCAAECRTKSAPAAMHCEARCMTRSWVTSEYAKAATSTDSRVTSSVSSASSTIGIPSG